MSGVTNQKATGFYSPSKVQRMTSTTIDISSRRTQLVGVAVSALRQVSEAGADWNEFLNILTDLQRIVASEGQFTPVSATTSAPTTASTSAPTTQRGNKKPMVSVEQSIQENYLVCLEDGRKLKTLKRHLFKKFGMTPDDYRAKWDLPASYPMVAPNYSKQRSEMALKMGLGSARKAANDVTANDVTAPAANDTTAPVEAKAVRAPRKARTETPAPAPTAEATAPSNDVINLTPKSAPVEQVSPAPAPAAAPIPASSVEDQWYGRIPVQGRPATFRGLPLPQPIIDMMAKNDMAITLNNVVKITVEGDQIYCLEDGEPVTLLKRKIKEFGMAPDTYIQKWGLPKDYPMAPQEYRDLRSQIAQKTHAPKPTASSAPDATKERVAETVA